MKMLQKMLGNRTGSSYWFIYSLAFLFVIGILYIVFNQTLLVYVYPTTQMLTNVSGIEHTETADQWLGFWGLVPFILILIIGMFIFFKLTQRDSVGE